MTFLVLIFNIENGDFHKKTKRFVSFNFVLVYLYGILE